MGRPCKNQKVAQSSTEDVRFIKGSIREDSDPNSDEFFRSIVEYREIYDDRVVIMKSGRYFCVRLIRYPEEVIRTFMPHKGIYPSYRNGGMFRDYTDVEDFFYRVCDRLEYNED